MLGKVSNPGHRERRAGRPGDAGGPPGSPLPFAAAAEIATVARAMLD